MPWVLTIRDPSGANTLATVTEATAPNPVMGDIDAVIDGRGRTSSINLRVRNDILQAPPRGILEYSAWRAYAVTYQGAPVTFEDAPVTVRDAYAPLAAGVIVTVPPTDSPGSGPADRDADALDRVTAEGLERLLRESIVKPRLWEGEADAATIAYEVCLEFAHPAVVVKEENFPPTGFLLGYFYAPELSVADALDRVRESVPGGASWWVDASREIVFRAGV